MDIRELSDCINKSLSILDKMGHHSNDAERMSEGNKEKMRELQRDTEKMIKLQQKYVR